MQRLRSPFRLRPGPGAEQRKGKARREHQGGYAHDNERSGNVTRNSPPQPTETDSAAESGDGQHGGARERQESSEPRQDAGSGSTGGE